MGVTRYAFTSLWCAYAAVASAMILAYFWTSSEDRPFSYKTRRIRSSMTN
jgi:hypothetical protein